MVRARSVRYTLACQCFEHGGGVSSCEQLHDRGKGRGPGSQHLGEVSAKRYHSMPPRKPCPGRNSITMNGSPSTSGEGSTSRTRGAGIPVARAPSCSPASVRTCRPGPGTRRNTNRPDIPTGTRQAQRHSWPRTHRPPGAWAVGSNQGEERPGHARLIAVGRQVHPIQQRSYRPDHCRLSETVPLTAAPITADRTEEDSRLRGRLKTIRYVPIPRRGSGCLSTPGRWGTRDHLKPSKVDDRTPIEAPGNLAELGGRTTGSRRVVVVYNRGIW